MSKKSAREEYRKAEIKLTELACDLLFDLMRERTEYYFGLPSGFLGRSETYKKAVKGLRSTCDITK